MSQRGAILLLLLLLKCPDLTSSSWNPPTLADIRDPGLINNMRKDHLSFVYIVANKRNGTLYIGVTSNLIKRIWQHKNKELKGFASLYNIDKLVYFEDCFTIMDAINREKEIKRFKRQWKIDLIEKSNPNWDDLYIKMIE